MPVANAPHLDLEWMTEGLPEEDARDIMYVSAPAWSGKGALAPASCYMGLTCSQQILDINTGAQATVSSTGDGAFAELLMSWQEQQDPTLS